MGIQHQAGSDSVVTAKLFFKLKEQLFQNHIDVKYHNMLYGLENELGYDSFGESPDDDSYFYPTNPSTVIEDYVEGSTQGHDLFYGSAYYRTTSPYSVSSYYIPTGFPQPNSQNMYTLFQSEGHTQ